MRFTHSVGMDRPGWKRTPQTGSNTSVRREYRASPTMPGSEGARATHPSENQRKRRKSLTTRASARARGSRWRSRTSATAVPSAHPAPPSHGTRTRSAYRVSPAW